MRRTQMRPINGTTASSVSVSTAPLMVMRSFHRTVSVPSQQSTKPGKLPMTGTMGKVAGLPDEPTLIYKINYTTTSGLSHPGTILQTPATFTLDSGSDVSVIGSHQPELAHVVINNTYSRKDYSETGRRHRISCFTNGHT